MLPNTLNVEIEGAVQSSRRYYNAVVRDYNTRLQSVQIATDQIHTIHKLFHLPVVLIPAPAL